MHARGVAKGGSLSEAGCELKSESSKVTITTDQP